MSDWNAEMYLRFETERTQPAKDLAARVTVESPKRVLDVGCGPGNSTKVLAERFPGAQVLGVDNSPDMLENAGKLHPELSFKLCDASKDLKSVGTGYDVVFSNACIQWIPDHARLLCEMLALLRQGGQLAIQIPVNMEEPIHQIITGLVESEWRDVIPTPRIFYTLRPEQYYEILVSQARSVNIWKTVYYHELDSHLALIDWYSATGLKPYLDMLDSNRREKFVGQVYKGVQQAYPVQANGKILFQFPRLFLLAISQ